MDEGIQRIVDAGGFGLAAAGMAIVFVALTVISAFIAVLPRILALFPAGLAGSVGGHAAPSPLASASQLASTPQLAKAPAATAESDPSVNPGIVAAIACAIVARESAGKDA